VKLWGAETGALQATLQRQAHGFMSGAFSPDGRIVLAGEGATSQLWHVAL
jgi:hypothetical protein